MNNEEKQIAEVIRAARTIQEFLWGKPDSKAGLEEFKRMFRKRVKKIDAINFDNPYWDVEMRKRLLQTAALAVKAIYRLDNNDITHAGAMSDGAPSNLPEYSERLK